MWLMYWKEIIAGVLLVVLSGVAFGMKWKIDSQANTIKELDLKIALYEAESSRLLKEYEENMKVYSEKEAQVEVVYRDRIKYIKESVDENDSCEDVVDNLNRYQF